MFLLAVAAVAVMAFGLNAGAQIRFGVLGGFTSSSTKAAEVTPESVSLYHAGVALKVPVGLGFAIQPQVTYQVKGTALNETIAGVTGSFDTKVGYLEVPVQIQWGPDLLVARPYVLAEPFVGYAVNMKSVASGSVGDVGASAEFTDIEESGLNRFEYGLGVGAGIEIWRLQLSARYFWNFGELAGDGKNAVNQAWDAISAGESFSGISVSLALFF